MKALISPEENNRIAEVAVQEFEVAQPLHWVDCTDDVTTQWTYVGGAFIAPIVPPKQFAPLSAWQVRKVLTQLGLRDKVETAVANADAKTKDAWNHASNFQRDDAILNATATSLGMSDTQLDNMFELGVTL